MITSAMWWMVVNIDHVNVLEETCSNQVLTCSSFSKREKEREKESKAQDKHGKEITKTKQIEKKDGERK